MVRKMGHMISKGPPKPGQGLDRASLSEPEKRLDERRPWLGLTNLPSLGHW